MAVDGRKVTTSEGAGNSRSGFSEAQKAIAGHFATQCGFCTPGVGICLEGLLREVGPNAKPTLEQCEKRLDGNLCRCTGYRPILDAFKSFAGPDMEDLGPGIAAARRAAALVAEPVPRFTRADPSTTAVFSGNGVTYYVPPDVASLYATLTQLVQAKTPHRLVGGNTGCGVYPPLRLIPAQVDVSRIASFQVVDNQTSATAISFGGAVTISRLIKAFEAVPGSPAWAATLLAHLHRVGGTHMRNAGTWAGNLAMTKTEGFASDLATLMMGLGATVLVYTPSTQQTAPMPLETFFSPQVSSSDFVLCKLTVPFPDPAAGAGYRTFKCSLRPQNSHALANASMQAALDVKAQKLSGVRIVYGALAGAGPFRAPKTEAALEGATLTAATLEAALRAVSQEVVPAVEPIDAYETLAQPRGKLAYRQTLVSSFLYRWFLAQCVLAGVTLGPGVASGAAGLQRPVSSGTQTYKTDPSLFPVGQPVPKLGSLLQASGEAVYTDDIPTPRGGMHGAFVLTPAAYGTLAAVDGTAALARYPGSHLVAAAAVRGANDIGLVPGEEPLFPAAGSAVLYAGQPVAMFVAATRADAEAGAAMVAVTVTPPAAGAPPPVLTINEAIAAKSFFSTNFPNQTVVWGDPAAVMPTCTHTANGTVVGGGQTHFYMEKSTVLALPDEGGGITLQASTQLPEDLRLAAAKVLGVPGSAVTVKLRRLGGAYGGKLSRSFPAAIATAVCAQYLGVPVRVQSDIHTDMRMTGGRHPIQSSFTVGFDGTGKIQAVTVTTYLNGGSTTDYTCNIAEAFNEALDSCYFVDNWSSVVIPCKTALPTNTANRSFGNIQAALVSESIVECVAEALGMAPEVVRERNAYTARNCVTPYGQSFFESFTLSTIWQQLKASSNFETRAAAVDAYNAQSKWVKRGISMVPVKYGVGWESTNATVNISSDGTVVVRVGGVEMGQGVFTKCAQVAAQTLGCPLEAVRVGDVDTTVIPNIKDSGGSVTSGENTQAVRLACLELVRGSLGPARATLAAGAAWADVVSVCYTNGLNLQGAGYFTPPGRTGLGIGVDGQWKSPACLFDYFIWGAAVSEVEVDVLTGEVQISQVDLLYDGGNLLNPAIDIGQCEGAFMFGVGYLFTEEVLTSPAGILNSSGTWEMKPPCSLNVPVRFNVSFLQDSPFLMGVMRSKALGEPPMILSRGVLSATRKAVLSARADREITATLPYYAPFTIDRILTACGVQSSDFTL